MTDYRPIRFDDSGVGQTFGSWLQLGPAFNAGNREKQAVFKCEKCQRVLCRNHTSVIRGRSTQCQHCKPGNWRTHGLSKTSEYHIWFGMIERCHNPKATGYSNYGGRGIAVCARWRCKESGFLAFLRDVGSRPSMSHQIDRVDVNGDYEPTNVQWATITRNARNKRTTVLLTIGDKTLCLSEWAEQEGAVSKSVIQHRLQRGFSHQDAVFAPLVKGRKRKAVAS